MIKRILCALLLLPVFVTGCNGQHSEKNQKSSMENKINVSGLDSATFGAGCFWCVEAAFGMFKGVEKVESGYSGGHVKNPAYREVCNGTTGHAEVARIYFDPKQISYDELLDVFWHVHDPTTMNRQGNDVGTQYRSVIFYNNEEQKIKAEESLKKADASRLWPSKIVTAIEPLTNFYVAEDYHQDYFAQNPEQPYCAAVIAPKIKKLREKYKGRLKD